MIPSLAARPPHDFCPITFLSRSHAGGFKARSLPPLCPVATSFLKISHSRGLSEAWLCFARPQRNGESRIFRWWNPDTPYSNITNAINHVFVEQLRPGNTGWQDTAGGLQVKTGYSCAYANAAMAACVMLQQRAGAKLRVLMHADYSQRSSPLPIIESTADAKEAQGGTPTDDPFTGTVLACS